MATPAPDPCADCGAPLPFPNLQDRCRRCRAATLDDTRALIDELGMPPRALVYAERVESELRAPRRRGDPQGVTYAVEVVGLYTRLEPAVAPDGRPLTKSAAPIYCARHRGQLLPIEVWRLRVWCSAAPGWLEVRWHPEEGPSKPTTVGVPLDDVHYFARARDLLPGPLRRLSGGDRTPDFAPEEAVELIVGAYAERAARFKGRPAQLLVAEDLGRSRSWLIANLRKAGVSWAEVRERAQARGAR